MKTASLQPPSDRLPSITPPVGARLRRVAIFSDALPERNGAGAYYHDLAAQLRDEVGSIELFQPAAMARHLRLAIPLPGDPTQKLITPNVTKLWKAFRHLRPDVVVAVTPGPFGLLGLCFARITGTPFLTAFHTHFEELTRLYGNALFCKSANAYLVSVNRILCKRSAAVLVNNDQLIPIVKKLGARHVEVMGTPLSKAFLSAPSKPPEALKNVLFAGRLAPEKNLPAVIAAARALPQLQFVLAGDGPLRNSLQRDASALPNVRMTGWLDRQELCREMDEAGLLLLPSHHETFGTVALEAMARGRPALVAESAGIHQWTTLREALFILRSGELLADALRSLIAQPPNVWRDKAASARKAAEALNRATIHQWIEYVNTYGRQRHG